MHREGDAQAVVQTARDSLRNLLSIDAPGASASDQPVLARTWARVQRACAQSIASLMLETSWMGHGLATTHETAVSAWRATPESTMKASPRN
jgi:hypothetical protein